MRDQGHVRCTGGVYIACAAREVQPSVHLAALEEDDPSRRVASLRDEKVGYGQLDAQRSAHSDQERLRGVAEARNRADNVQV